MKCDKCGKEVKYSIPSLLEKGLCEECRVGIFIEVCQGKKRMCTSCAFLEDRLGDVSERCFCKKIDLELTPSLHAGRIPLYLQANDCVHFMDRTEYEKKALRGEIEPAKVRCQYCSILFDSTLDKCPNCGGKR